MDEEEVRKEGEKVLEELSRALEEIDLAETYYVVDEINVTRRDASGRVDEEFKLILRRNAPRLEEDGSFVMEVGKWVE
ncbi:MAG: Asp-tRNA(Asn) amidotransferase GatCAB subunit C [Euryarchaeota archaeon]|nr:Asp-tRNA(Asn) amidotransferase GatCAB subunit C [Euryarchaeota archaeon]